MLVKFCKVLKELKLDYNIGVFITGVDCVYNQNRLDNLVYLLRSCSLYFPNFLKVLLTVDNTPTASDYGTKILKLLATKSVVEIDDKETFFNEGRSYLEFALAYGAGDF